MNYATQYNFTIIFTLIYLYLILRILVNTKYKNTNVVKEIFLTGFVISIIYVISFTILFISKNPNIITKDNIIPFKSIYYLFMNNNILFSICSIIPGILLFIPIGFFAYPSIEYSFKDTMIICLLFSLGIMFSHIINPDKVINIDDFILNIIGGIIGIFLSYTFTKKAQLI